MARGTSIHIGLNWVDPDAYGGWDGQLAGCENDARDMQAITNSMGFTSMLLLNHEATSARVIEEIARSAQKLSSGDTFVLTYSGHGGNMPDVNGDEDDGQDETWVLFDRQVLDDELYQLWSQFSAGVRIFMLSDSCHSGTVVREPFYRQVLNVDTLARGYRATRNSPPKMRSIPDAVRDRNYEQYRTNYNTIQWSSGRGDRSAIGASIVLISGCQDNQLSADGDGNGLFTGTLKQVWNNGSFKGNYHAFQQEILDHMPPSQSPNYYTTGAHNMAFEAESPFTIANGSTPVTPDETETQPTTPSVSGSSSWDRSDNSPSFHFEFGSNRYAIFEITSELGVLSDYNQMTDENTYATWNDQDQPARLTSSTFVLPQQAWEMFQNSADTLYYRIATTSSSAADQWDNYMVSDYATMELTGARSPSTRPPSARSRSKSSSRARSAPAETDVWQSDEWSPIDPRTSGGKEKAE